MRIRRVVVNVFQSGSNISESVTYSYPECNISFNISSTDSKSPTGCYVSIDGVSTKTYSIFDHEKNKDYIDNQRVEIYYGYDSELSLVYSGTIERVMYKFNQGNQTLMMTITEQKKKFSKEERAISLNGTQTIHSAVSSICREFGYECEFGPGDFSAISIGRYGASTTLREALTDILPYTCDYRVREGKVRVFLRENEMPTEITLHSQNGMLEYPTEDSAGKATQIKAVLIPEAEVGLLINIPIDEYWFSPTDTGTYRKFRVDNFTSSFQNGIGTTSFECSDGDKK